MASTPTIVSDETDAFINRQLVVLTAGVMASAEATDDSREQFLGTETVLAAAVYYNRRFWISSFLHCLSTPVKRGEYKAIALMTFGMYDETPLK